MMKDPYVCLDDMLTSIRAIQAYCRGMTFEDFLLDAKTQDAVIRRFEVLG